MPAGWRRIRSTRSRWSRPESAGSRPSRFWSGAASRPGWRGRIERLEQSILAAAERLAAEGEKPGWERQMREAMRRAFGADLAAVPAIAAEAMPAVFSEAGPDFSMLPGESRFCQRPGLEALQGWRHYQIGTNACVNLKALPESFSFCKDFSGGKRALVEVPIIRLHGCHLSERLMRVAGVAEALEFGQLAVESTHAQLAGALDAAAMLGAFGRQREQFDVALLAGGLELGRGLAAAVDLHRLDIERRLADQVVKQLRGAGGGGAHAAKLRDRAHSRGLGLLDAEAGLDGDARPKYASSAPTR